MNTQNNINELADELFSAIFKQQQNYNRVVPPDPKLAEEMKELLKDYESKKGRGFFFQYYATGNGHGPFTELRDGSVKYDLINAIGVNILGHSHPITIKSHLEAAMQDTTMCGNLLTHPEAHQLSTKLLQCVKSNSKLEHFWYTCSGSMANDTALKIIWQKKYPRAKVLAFNKAFAGRSVATQDITYNASYREGQHKSVDVVHVPHFDQNDPSNALTKTLNALNEAYNASPNDFAAISLELIQGEGGFIYGDKNYYETIFKWAKERDLAIWVDEVQSFARTRELFAFQMFGLGEYVDIVSVGKALQACGILFTKEMNPKPGLIAGTFNGSISALKAGKKILDLLTNGPFYGDHGRMASLEKTFITRLNELKEKDLKGKIGFVGGVGTMITFEVANGEADATNNFVKKLFDNGLIVFTAGKDPTRVRMLLPITLLPEHIDEIFEIIKKVGREVL